MLLIPVATLVPLSYSSPSASFSSPSFRCPCCTLLPLPPVAAVSGIHISAVRIETTATVSARARVTGCRIAGGRKKKKEEGKKDNEGKKEEEEKEETGPSPPVPVVEKEDFSAVPALAATTVVAAATCSSSSSGWNQDKERNSVMQIRRIWAREEEKMKDKKVDNFARSFVSVFDDNDDDDVVVLPALLAMLLLNLFLLVCRATITLL